MKTIVKEMTLDKAKKRIADPMFQWRTLRLLSRANLKIYSECITEREADLEYAACEFLKDEEDLEIKPYVIVRLTAWLASIGLRAMSFPSDTREALPYILHVLHARDKPGPRGALFARLGRRTHHQTRTKRQVLHPAPVSTFGSYVCCG